MTQDTSLKQFEIPADLKVGGLLSSALRSEEKTRMAIEKAAEILNDDPSLELRFTKIFNVITCGNDSDLEFVRRCKADFPKENDGREMDFDVFAWSVTHIKKFGWENYIQALRNRKPEAKFDRPLASRI